MKRIRIIVSAAGFAALGACASYQSPGETISIPYDPYDFHADDLQAEADAHCAAYNLRAVYEDETADPSSVRWRYRHYRCV